MEANIYESGDKESNQTNSNSKDSSGNSHFQFHKNPTYFTGTKKFKTYREDSVKIPGVTTPTGMVLQQAFEEHNIKLMFKESHSKSIKLDISNVIILDSQSTMESFWNTKFVRNTYKDKKKMQLQSNRGKMLITHKAQVAG